VRRSGWCRWGSALHLGSRRTSVLFCLFSQMNATHKRCVPFLLKNASRYKVKDFRMTTLYSHEKHARRRLLKRSNSPFFRQMLHVASTPLCLPLPTSISYTLLTERKGIGKRNSQDPIGVLGMIAEPTGTDRHRLLSHQCWSTSSPRTASSLKDSSHSNTCSGVFPSHNGTTASRAT
jgi:hypothetical protein